VSVAEPQVVAPDSALWPPRRGSPLVALALARTAVERRLIDDFVARLPSDAEVPPVEVTYDVHHALARAARDDAAIAPVGVAWLPPEREGDRHFSILDLLALSDPARPRARVQKRILDRAPSRCRVTVGEPARRSELLARWEGHSGRPDDGREFEVFVERQARLALDRAERSMLGARYKTAQDIVEDLLASRRFREGAEALAATLGRSPREVVPEARTALTELASVQNRFARDVWVQLARFLWARAYRAEVDVAGIERLRELNKRYPLVFLPSHKSNLDGFVMATVMYDFSFPQNHVIGGKNMGFWPLGTLGRRVGVVWIRRSFGGDAVYKFALRRYLAHLASKRFNLEWYIEGGRSRSGKLLPPRMGLLSYLAQGVEEAEVEDVLLVPVSIVYDRLHEVIEMTAESRGAAKQPEGFRWLVRYARQQRGELGRVQVNFGEPLALRGALAAAPSAEPNGRSLALSKAAFEVCTRINRATPVTPISIATLALLGMDGWAVTLAQAGRAIEPLVGYVQQRALPGSDSLAPLRSSEGVLRVLAALAEHGVVERFGGSEPVYRISPERELAAAFYRNVVIHWFVNRAIVELALVAAAESEQGSDPIAVALAEALRLRDLLKFEFFFAEKSEFEAELRTEVGLIDPSWRDKGGAGLQTLGEALAQTGTLMADRVLRSFLEAYYVVADRLAAHGGASVEESDLVRECLLVGRQYQLQRRIVTAEAVSAELFKTGLRLAGNRELLAGEANGLAQRRLAFVAEIHDVLRRLEILARWDRSHRVRREGEIERVHPVADVAVVE
jgi:glycerol-3-phosphate O-acyltransferase